MAMGSPAKFTTPPMAPSMPLAQSFFAKKVSFGMPASLLADFAGSRVSTRTLTPRATSRRTRRAPTVPVAPVMATSPLIPGGEELAAAAATAAKLLVEARQATRGEGRGGGAVESVVVRSTATLLAAAVGDDLATSGPERALVGCVFPRRDALDVESIFMGALICRRKREGEFRGAKEESVCELGARNRKITRMKKRKKKLGKKIKNLAPLHFFSSASFSFFFFASSSSSRACATASLSLSCWSGSGLFPATGSLNPPRAPMPVAPPSPSTETARAPVTGSYPKASNSSLAVVPCAETSPCWSNPVPGPRGLAEEGALGWSAAPC